jgi:hypothetical protein
MLQVLFTSSDPVLGKWCNTFTLGRVLHFSVNATLGCELCTLVQGADQSLGSVLLHKYHTPVRVVAFHANF